MQEFTPDESQRWDAWQESNAVSVRRSDRIARLVGMTMLAAALIAFAVALWR